MTIKERYLRHIQELVRDNPYAIAMGLAVGDDPEKIGAIELALLQHLGLRDCDYLIDVGCGSGRLTKPLSRVHKGRYLGTDLVAELLDYNRSHNGKNGWRFEEVGDQLVIPEADGVADMVCFFSVFTHLAHEQSYLYLQEAKRVVRSGGQIVFSYLDFGIALHWEIFLQTVERERIGLGKDAVPNIFLDQAAIERWADSLELKVLALHGGEERFIPIKDPQGREELSAFGQSVCLLQPT